MNSLPRKRQRAQSKCLGLRARVRKITKPKSHKEHIVMQSILDIEKDLKEFRDWNEQRIRPLFTARSTEQCERTPDRQKKDLELPGNCRLSDSITTWDERSAFSVNVDFTSMACEFRQKEEGQQSYFSQRSTVHNQECARRCTVGDANSAKKKFIFF